MSIQRLATLVVSFGGAIGIVTTGVVKSKSWFDAHYVTVETYRADREAYRAKRFADSVHHAADDMVEARVQQALDSLRKRCRAGCSSTHVIQAGNAR